MIYRTTKRCDQDIVDIYVYGAAHFGSDQAERYNAAPIHTFELLGRNPRIARLRPEFRPPVRLHPHGSHVIAYSETDSGILVVRVLHARQDRRRHL